MNIQGFCQSLPALWDGDPQTDDFPKSRRFQGLADQTGGMGTENKYTLLNHAARHLAQDEVYLEIGAYRGTSIIAAAIDNLSKLFFTIDNFSEFGGPVDECEQNIQRWTEGNVHLINADAWITLINPPFDAPVGVYFYDGPHKFDDHWRALQDVEPHLADRALVIVDDTAHPPAAAATSSYIDDRSEWNVLMSFTSPYNGEPRWWNGVQVLSFHRSDSVSSSGESPPPR